MTSLRYEVADRRKAAAADFWLRWEVLLLVLLGIVMLVNSRLSPWFLDYYNLLDSTFNFSEKAIMALSMTLIIVTRDIDLSVASIIALASVFMGLAAQAGAGVPLLVLIGLATGLLAGFANGAIITRFQIPAIVVTIGTMSLFRGIAYVVLGDTAITSYPAGFSWFGQSYLVWSIPFEFVLFLVLAAVFGFVLHFTTTGRRIYAIGNNPVAARFSGIPVDRYRLVLFTLNGLMAGLAAVLLTSRIGSTRPNIAAGWELEVITMVVLGGVSIMGGSGTISGVFIAVFVLGMMTFGLSLMNVPGIVMSVFVGVLLIASIAVPILIRRMLRR
ncbi:rhamnose transport system permease protein [Skermanella aerolata]|uniref:Autoinducer 2 import system permease protein LsrD n=1 Tax=Skermanella aerolata TaxID=393310 RepID=A0A512DI65_9PROT|nr:ABC transporter permease [Skermanella aerolata]KJB97583.1 branched-chain amino acid ABC transporter permease [Skermanella aerolata KACC 11604]GEO36168.1 ABC transporter permease [Skermanella aerolata]